MVPGLKALKGLQVHGEKFRVERYRPLESNGDSEYDVVTGTLSCSLSSIFGITFSTVL